MTHETLCLHGLHWAASQRWAEFAAHEVTLTRPRWWAAEWFDKPGRLPVHNPRADVVAVGPERVAILEAKVTRADLLADLRASKMQRHYGWATHCYLLLGGEVAHMDLTELGQLGLPPQWGVLRCGATTEVHTLAPPKPSSARTARRLRRLSASDVSDVRRAIGRSLSWRVLRMAS